MEEKWFEEIPASYQMEDNKAFPVWRWVGKFFFFCFFALDGTQSPHGLSWKVESSARKSKMQVLSFLLISFACVICPSLGKGGNYNEAEQSLPGDEWLNPWDMIHYDAAAQSLDNTVSLFLISHVFVSFSSYKLNVFFAEHASLLKVILFLSLLIVFLVFSVNFLAA